MAEFVTVMKEFARMCEAERCKKCEMNDPDDDVSCSLWAKKHPEEAEKIIMDWAAANPVETMKDRFVKMFPDADLEDDGAPKCCPHHLGWAKRCWKHKGIEATCSACWNRPYEERNAK